MIRRAMIIIAAVFCASCRIGVSSALADNTCADPGAALGVERVVDIDTANGPLFGDLSVLAREPSFLGPREVVLTFDDGPMPWITKSILDTLDRFCTKATFFSVGSMAVAYPASVRDVLARGHTLGGHTWSHPLNLKRRGLDRAIDEIERGFAAVALAAGQPIAPFFRFPGLSDSDPMMAHLQARGIAAFTVDVVSNDSYIANADRLAAYTLAQIDKRQGGIVLFHDIKSATAKALPVILAGIKQRGYKIVHMRAKSPLVPLDTFNADLEKRLVKTDPARKSPLIIASATGTPPQPEVPQPHLLPFFGSPAVLKTLAGADAEVTTLAPAQRPRIVVTTNDNTEPATHGSKSDRAHTGHKAKPARIKRATADDPPFKIFGF